MTSSLLPALTTKLSEGHPIQASVSEETFQAFQTMTGHKRALAATLLSHYFNTITTELKNELRTIDNHPKPYDNTPATDDLIRKIFCRVQLRQFDGNRVEQHEPGAKNRTSARVEISPH